MEGVTGVGATEGARAGVRVGKQAVLALVVVETGEVRWRRRWWRWRRR